MGTHSEIVAGNEVHGEELGRRSYAASIAVIRSVVPHLKRGDDMCARLEHQVKAVPRLIAAGLYGDVPAQRRHHSLAEAALACREAVVMLSYCRDLHGRFINGVLCSDLIETYRYMGDELGKIAASAPAETGGRL